MTYCVGMLVDEGLAMIADTRTNAGVDNISSYRKLHIYKSPGERILAVATAGRQPRSSRPMPSRGCRAPPAKGADTTSPSSTRLSPAIYGQMRSPACKP